MFVKKSKSHGRVYLSYVQGYRNEQGKIRHKTIKKIGYLDELEKEVNDPFAFYSAIAKQKTKEEITEYTIKNINTQTIDENDSSKNIGYFIPKIIYNQLGIKEFLKIKQKSINTEFSLNDILSMLVFMRILRPGSKKDNYENMNILFENYDFTLDSVYSCLTYLNPLKEAIQKVIWENTKDKFNRNTGYSYYDCTNYYFEIEYDDDDIFDYDENGNVLYDKNNLPIIKQKGLRKRGPEKNHRPDPIVELGLLMDSSGIPLSYDLFPGNESEKESLIPIINRTKRDFQINRTIVVADRGLNCSDNILKISGTSLEQALKMNGYVYGKSVRGATEEFKKWVLQDDYINDEIVDDNGKKILFKHKSRIYPTIMHVIRDDKGKTKSGNKKRQDITVDQKQMVYYSQKYADKQKRDREKIILKAKDLINHPDKYTRATSYGVAGYVNNLKFVKSTGEIADASSLSINQSKIDEEAKYDGYYAIVTSEEKLSDIEIRNIYRGLAKIEESFKVTKTGLESRPVWVSRADHIQSHFLTCFIALVIIRLIEKKLDNKFSFNQVVDSIRNYSSINIEHDLFKQTFRNDVIKCIESKFNINLSKKFLTLSEIKKLIKI